MNSITHSSISSFKPSIRIRGFCSRSSVPLPVNEPIKGYLKSSPERTELEKEIKRQRSIQVDIPLIIGGKEVRTGKTATISPPHDHKHKLGVYHKAGPEEVRKAIESALNAKKAWRSLDWDSRAAIFLKFAELLAGPYRQVLNAATVLNQSKNFYQAEIDAACELIDFTRFNIHYAQEMYAVQPINPPGVWNRVIYRPLEGFVYAITPFNFTAIAGNLACAPAILGNTVVWKPSDSAILSGYTLMQLYKEAGLPDGVINFIPGEPEEVSKIILDHPELAGVHYTGSTEIFRHIWKQVSERLPQYKNYPRIVGETGGKDYIFAHSSAHVDQLVVALVRGAFEYAGQKCSAASRAYVPKTLWDSQVKDKLVSMMKQIKLGNPEEATTFVNAVIHQRSFDKCKAYIQYAKESKDAAILFGGSCDDTVGYFVQPTIVVTSNPNFKLLREEIFGPILTIYVYPDDKFEETLNHCDHVSQYALTGAIFAQDRTVIQRASKLLEYSAGNFYINDKCTGAVVGQQPFGGSRGSGTNDKAGFGLNLQRWVSLQSIKETFSAPTQFDYPYMRN